MPHRKFIAKIFMLGIMVVYLAACSPAYYTLPPYPPPPQNRSGLPPYSSTPQVTRQPETTQPIQPDARYPEPSAGVEKPRIPEEKSPQRIASAELVDRARDLALSGRVDEALGLLERAIEIDAYNGEAFYEMARCWELKGDHRRALTFIDRAILIFEGRPEKTRKAYLLKSQILSRLGQKEEARRLELLANPQ